MCLAVPGEIVSISGTDDLMRIGRVDFGGIVKEINLAYVPEAGIGDYVLVHVGFAISILNAEEARRTLAYLESLGETEIDTNVTSMEKPL